jgi:hypothetical protein
VSPFLGNEGNVYGDNYSQCTFLQRIDCIAKLDSPTVLYDKLKYFDTLYAVAHSYDAIVVTRPMLGQKYRVNVMCP